MAPLMNLGIGTELIYSFVIIFCSLMVYYSTKKIYHLSEYKGIKYFSYSFLFFALAYFSRSFIKFILFYFNSGRILDFSPRIFGDITIFIFIYLSSMAVFYLLYSVMWKKWNGSGRIYLFHILAAAMAFAGFIAHSPQIYLLINLVLLLFVIFIVYESYKVSSDRKKKNNLYIIYFLLLIFWILNILDIFIPDFLQTFQMIYYLASIAIFLTILYKVIKKTN
jgi:hypothetical protein